MGPDGRRARAAASSLPLSLEIGSPRLLVPLVLPFFFLIILKVDHLLVDDDLLASSSRARPSASEDSSDKDGGGGQLILSRAHSTLQQRGGRPRSRLISEAVQQGCERPL